MSYSISSLITKLTGDFSIDQDVEPDAYEAACVRCGADPKDFLGSYKKISEAERQVETLVRRYLEQQVGEFQVEDRSTHQMTTLKVTRFVGKYCYQRYTAWCDSGATTFSPGFIKLEVLTRLPTGRYWSPARRKDGDEIWPSIGHKHAPYHVYVEEVETFGNSFEGGNLRGTGSGLMQIAAEVCQQHIPVEKREQTDFGIHVLLKAAYNSPGFYRTVQFTTGYWDQPIDDELTKAKKENRKPDTSKFGGIMYLDDAGRAHYAEQIAKKPVLQRSILLPTETLKLV